jgi:hypothetical protein
MVLRPAGGTESGRLRGIDPEHRGYETDAIPSGS